MVTVRLPEGLVVIVRLTVPSARTEYVLPVPASTCVKGEPSWLVQPPAVMALMPSNVSEPALFMPASREHAREVGGSRRAGEEYARLHHFKQAGKACELAAAGEILHGGKFAGGGEDWNRVSWRESLHG